MSTRTIHKTVSNKVELFQLVADDSIESSIGHLIEPAGTASSQDAIRAQVLSYTTLVLGNDGVLKARAVFSKQGQFPVCRGNYLSSIQQAATAFVRRFATLCADVPGVDTAQIPQGAAFLRSATNGAQREAILDPAYEATPASIRAWLDTCPDFALRALRAGDRGFGIGAASQNVRRPCGCQKGISVGQRAFFVATGVHLRLDPATDDQRDDKADDGDGPQTDG
jgi:hypothetical protein